MPHATQRRRAGESHQTSRFNYFGACPNTEHTLKSPPKEVPNDMKRVFDLIDGAKHAVLFLAFDPGNNSILDAAGRALSKNPDLFVRGALTSAQRARNFSAALHQGGHADQNAEKGRDGASEGR